MVQDITITHTLHSQDYIHRTLPYAPSPSPYQLLLYQYQYQYPYRIIPIIPSSHPIPPFPPSSILLVHPLPPSPYTPSLIPPSPFPSPNTSPTFRPRNNTERHRSAYLNPYYQAPAPSAQKTLSRSLTKLQIGNKEKKKKKKKNQVSCLSFPFFLSFFILYYNTGTSTTLICPFPFTRLTKGDYPVFSLVLLFFFFFLYFLSSSQTRPNQTKTKPNPSARPQNQNLAIVAPLPPLPPPPPPPHFFTPSSLSFPSLASLHYIRYSFNSALCSVTPTSQKKRKNPLQKEKPHTRLVFIFCP